MPISHLPDTLPAIAPIPVRAPGRRLQVAIVDEELPFPAVSGKRIRTLNLTLRLARRHQLTYLCHRNADPDEARRAADFFNDHGIATVVVDRAVPRKSGPLFYARLAANLLSPLPYSVASHTSRALRRALQAHAARHPVDLWQCEWTPYAEALRGLDAAPRLIVAHNVESQIWQRYYETEAHPLRRWYIGRQWHKFERFERRAFAQATCAVAVSSEDAARISGPFEASHVDVVENGVDTDYFRPGPGPRDPRRLLFLGSLEWRPNLDAAALLLRQVFPAVRDAEPDARLALVGRNPPEWLRRQAAACPGVELHANPEDVRPYLQSCGALAVPLRIGGGSRLKILEALACGLPVVSTRVGAEGLRLEPGRHLTVVEGIADLAPALVDIIREPARAGAQAACGRRRVLDEYDWDTLADRLEQVWLRCAAARGNPDNSEGNS
jgi:glycosyltransferase involved in cell wall biosynthesis